MGDLVLRNPTPSGRMTGWTAVLLDESGEGFAEYNVVLSAFAIQCVIGALVLSHRIDDIFHAIRAIL